MGKTDIRPNYFNDVLMALGLLTRLPLPRVNWPEDRVAAHSAWAYPLVGLIVACIAGSGAWLLLQFGTPASFAAGLALLTSALVTGAMHEDGLADCADGFWGGWDRERRLKIMKDSSTGAYGVTALIIGFGLRWSALDAAFAQGWVFIPLIVAGVTSRAGMVWCMATLPNARTDGLSSTTGRPSLSVASLASLWAILVCGLGYGFSGVTIIFVVALTTVLWALIAMRKVNGQTGDVLGGTQQICEIAALGAIVALI